MNVTDYKKKYKFAVKRCIVLGVPHEAILNSPNGLVLRLYLSCLAISHIQGFPKKLIDKIIHEIAINLNLSTEKIEAIFDVEIARQQIIKEMNPQVGS